MIAGGRRNDRTRLNDSIPGYLQRSVGREALYRQIQGISKAYIYRTWRKMKKGGVTYSYRIEKLSGQLAISYRGKTYDMVACCLRSKGKVRLMGHNRVVHLPLPTREIACRSVLENILTVLKLSREAY